MMRGERAIHAPTTVDDWKATADGLAARFVISPAFGDASMKPADDERM